MTFLNFCNHAASTSVCLECSRNVYAQSGICNKFNFPISSNLKFLYKGQRSLQQIQENLNKLIMRNIHLSLKSILSLLLGLASDCNQIGLSRSKYIYILYRTETGITITVKP